MLHIILLGSKIQGNRITKKGIIKQNKCDTRPIRVYYYEIADTGIVRTSAIEIIRVVMGIVWMSDTTRREGIDLADLVIRLMFLC